MTWADFVPGMKPRTQKVLKHTLYIHGPVTDGKSHILTSYTSNHYYQDVFIWHKEAE